MAMFISIMELAGSALLHPPYIFRFLPTELPRCGNERYQRADALGELVSGSEDIKVVFVDV